MEFVVFDGRTFFETAKNSGIVIASDKSFEQFMLVEEDWEDLTIILKILKPLEEATRYLLASKHPTIISSMRTYDGLMIQVGKAARTYKGGVRRRRSPKIFSRGSYRW